MKIYHYIILALLLLAASCSSSDEPVSPEYTGGNDGETCELVVSLEADFPVTATDMSTRADATWGDPYPEEADYPSERNIKSLFLYLVLPDESVYPLTPTKTNENNGLYEYKVKINLNDKFVTKGDDGIAYLSGRIVAMANLPGGTPASPFTFSPVNISGIEENGIPMWGVTSLNNLALIKNGTVNVTEPVKLLRSLPKITFQISDDFKQDYKITAVTSPYNDFEQTTYCQPHGALYANYTTSLSIEDCFNPAPSESSKGSITKCYGLGTDKVWIYTAERNCLKAADGKPPHFVVTLARRDGKGIPFTGNVYLCDYYQAGDSKGQPDYSTSFTRLVRNHDYQYIISLTPLMFEISFREWVFGGKVHIELE